MRFRSNQLIQFRGKRSIGKLYDFLTSLEGNNTGVTEKNTCGKKKECPSSDAIEFWELPERLQGLGFTNTECDLVLQGANDNVPDWNKIKLE